MRPALATFLVVVCAVVTAAAVWAFELSLERALLLAPVLLVGGAAIAGLLLVWSRAFLDTIRGPRRSNGL